MLAVGATLPRDLVVPGRELQGIHQAMDYLPQANRAALGERVEDQIHAKGKHVVIIGGGDTVQTVGYRDPPGCASITQLEIMERPGSRALPISRGRPIR
ncbi:MAG: hypothetical protein R2693_06630 [Nocardioidaceae bacterium]